MVVRAQELLTIASGAPLARNLPSNLTIRFITSDEERKEQMKLISNRILLVMLTALWVSASVSACGGSPAQQTPTQDAVPVGSIKINAHPTSLEGKTVVLRWNGKPNGDKFISRIGELLTEKVNGIKVIKLWETDPSTAVTSLTTTHSAAVADKIAALKPDLVIGLQCD